MTESPSFGEIIKGDDSWWSFVEVIDENDNPSPPEEAVNENDKRSFITKVIDWFRVVKDVLRSVFRQIVRGFNTEKNYHETVAGPSTRAVELFRPR